jgi:hypothetical protein
MGVLSIKKSFLILCTTRKPNPLTIGLVWFGFNSKSADLMMNSTQYMLNGLGN